MTDGPTPDVPKAYLLALVQAVIAVAVAFGLHITRQQQYSIEGLSALVAVGLIWGYTHLAKHRLQNLDKLVAARGVQGTGRTKADGDPQQVAY